MMTWTWQDLATWAIVGSALMFLIRRLVPGASSKPAGGCSHCPSSKGNAGGCRGDEPVVVTLGGLSQGGGRKEA